MLGFPGHRLISIPLAIIMAAFVCSLAHAEPPLGEIRARLAEKDYWKPSPRALTALDARTLDEGLKKIDPYARYVPPASFRGHSAQDSPYLFGVEIFVHGSELWVKAYPGSPAERAGLPEIGVLESIGASRVKAADLAGALSLLDRSKGKGAVFLTVSGRPGVTGTQYRVKPSAYRFPSVTWKRVDGWLVIGINEFVAHDTATTVSSIYQTMVKPDTRVIMDLRGCAGGDLVECIGVAGMFVPSGRLMLNTFNRSGIERSYRSPQGPKFKSPALVLMDGHTASSAETLAGILRHHRLCTLMGEQSYGKWESQVYLPLSDGGGLWLTNIVIRLPDTSLVIGKKLRPDILYPDITVSTLADITLKTKEIFSHAP